MTLNMLENTAIAANATTTLIDIKPTDFVSVQEIIPHIIPDLRYAGANNIVGRPITGYLKPVCLLTRPAATALLQVQQELLQHHPSLKLRIYDCYRPQMAVDDFIRWSQDASDQKTKSQYYPNVDKADLFSLGYFAAKSGHTRGSTIDLTIDGLEMGTEFDFMDPRSHFSSSDISLVQQKNRVYLKNLMEKHGFKAYPTEWWHFTLRQEPYPHTYFNFPVE